MAKYLDYERLQTLVTKLKESDAQKANSADLAKVATSGAAADVSVSVSGLSSTDVQSALAEVAAATGAVPEYSLAKQETAEEGMSATYYLTKDGAQVGEKINIAKDFLVRNASLLEVETADTPVTGYEVGQKYIDFEVNTTDDSETSTHIYLLVNDLVDVYTEGNGITISSANVISIKINSTYTNGLIATSDGLGLTLASSTAAGAMSATDKAKLDTIEEGANNYEHPTSAAGAVTSGLYKITTDANGHVIAVTAVTKTDITALGIPAEDTDTTYDEATTTTAGLMSATDKTKLDEIEAITDEEIEALFTE